MANEDLGTRISEVGQDPARATRDQGEMQSRGLRALIEADRRRLASAVTWPQSPPTPTVGELRARVRNGCAEHQAVRGGRHSAACTRRAGAGMVWGEGAAAMRDSTEIRRALVRGAEEQRVKGTDYEGLGGDW